MKKASKAADFLQNMTEDLAAIQPPGPREKVEAQGRKQPSSTRAGLKHIGGRVSGRGNGGKGGSAQSAAQPR